MRGLIPMVLLAAGAACAQTETKSFRFSEGGGYMDLLHGERPVYRYVTPAYDASKHAETFKVFHHVHGFHGEGMLTKGHGGNFEHHRGLFLGWFRIKAGADSMDSWHGAAGASIRHVKYLPERDLIGAKARRASVAEWTLKSGKVLVRETREVTAWLEDGKLYLDWALTLASAIDDSVTLDGDPAHSGFQFRADSVIKTFEYLGPADKSAAGDEWKMQPGNSWILCKFALQTHGYAVMQMDHPLNPRPVIAQKRDYGRFGHFFRATLPKGKPVTFHFRTLVLDTDKLGAPTVASAQGWYDEYAKTNPASLGGRLLLSGAGKQAPFRRALWEGHDLRGRAR